MDQKKRNRTGVYLLLITIIVACYICMGIRETERLHECPVYIHAWMQNDRYALTEEYAENGGDLFHLQLHNLKLNSEGYLQNAVTFTVLIGD